jgi:acetyltransferase-like isoleucine patch superfamily enzyme
MEHLKSMLRDVRGFWRWLLLWMLVPLPSRIKVPIYRSVFGYRIGHDVDIGLVLIRVGKLHIGDHVRVRHFTRFKDVPEVIIGSHCVIDILNEFYTSPEFSCLDSLSQRRNRPRLVIGDHCGITPSHYFAVQDEVEIGRFTTIGGRNSSFFTNQLDVATNTQFAGPIRIGEYCLVASNVSFAPGARIADKCIVGMGAVVVKGFDEPHSLIAGNPARVVKQLSPDSAYFHRRAGSVSSYLGSPFGPAFDGEITPAPSR